MKTGKNIFQKISQFVNDLKWGGEALGAVETFARELSCYQTFADQDFVAKFSARFGLLAIRSLRTQIEN